jgi:16S rRNA A1518/A1519 N6-dimethyltransferase RsmA/KsgA/DIM1 with predicted DNA glycosylase/AP lyase activity
VFDCWDGARTEALIRRGSELYDRTRPSYPSALVADVISIADLGASERLLEVGAGTGKATLVFASRGFPVLAIEPSPEMAAIARRNCGPYPGVRIEQSDFERRRYARCVLEPRR